MGFMKPKMPSLPAPVAPVEEIPTIKVETIELDTDNNVAQKQKHRKGILSTILSKPSPVLDTPSPAPDAKEPLKTCLG